MREPWGIFYTAVTGIWQTVWLEEVPEVPEVPEVSVERLVVTPDLDQKSVWVQVVVRGGGGTEAVSIEVEDVEKVVVLGNGVAGRRIEIPLGEVKTCSPWAPFLYGFPVRVEDGVFPVWTAWTEGEIWLRREFELDDVGVGDLMLEILNNGDATVYLNGVDLGKRGVWSPLYRLTVLGDKAEAALRKGRNVIAVKVGGGRLRRFIDVGLVGYE